MKTPLEKLQARWYRKTGGPMPEAIAKLPIERVRAAVDLTESGATVFVPSAEPVYEFKDGIGYGDSMREWDSEGYY